MKKKLQHKPLPPRPNPTQPLSPAKSPRTSDEASSPTPSFHGQISDETHHSPATGPTPLSATTEPSPTNPTLRRQTQHPYLLRLTISPFFHNPRNPRSCQSQNQILLPLPDLCTRWHQVGRTPRKERKFPAALRRYVLQKICTLFSFYEFYKKIAPILQIYEFFLSLFVSVLFFFFFFFFFFL
jgi:hypothetical protein